MPSKFLNADIDSTLGGTSPSDAVIPSQKAIKTYTDAELDKKVSDVTIDSTSIVSSGIADIPLSSTSAFGVVKIKNGSSEPLQIVSGVLSVNKATGTNALTIAGNASASADSTNVGIDSSVYGAGSVAYGYQAQVGTSSANVAGAIQLGKGQTTEAGTFNVGLSSDGSTWNNYQVLKSDGKVPLDRLNITYDSEHKRLSWN